MHSMCKCFASVSNSKGIWADPCFSGGLWWQLCAGWACETWEPYLELPHQVHVLTHTHHTYHQQFSQSVHIHHLLCIFIRFSGITPVMLRPIKTTLKDVQIKLRTLLPSDAVLVGHSLNNDLTALKVRYWIFSVSLLLELFELKVFLSMLCVYGYKCVFSKPYSSWGPELNWLHIFTRAYQSCSNN